MTNRPRVVVFDGSDRDPVRELEQQIPGGLSGEDGVITCATTIQARSADGRSESGVWRCDPCDWAPMEMGDRAEFFHVLEGSMVLREPDGTEFVASAGMSVYSPPGWAGTWRVPSRLLKVFVSFHPAN